MDIYEVAAQVPGSGEYVLGADATGSHACYLIYGVLKAGEQGRELRPGKGHEEMVLCMAGRMKLSGAWTVVLGPGQAIHLRGEDRCLAGNDGTDDAVYVIAGGHAGSAHH